MKRTIAVPPGLVIAGLLVGFVLVAFGTRAAVVWWMGHRGDPEDTLGWVEREFHPSAEQRTALRDIHRRYAPLRTEVARDLARQRDLLVAQVAGASTVSPALRAAAEDWDRLAARSHDLTWRYVLEMSEALPADQARRFRGGDGAFGARPHGRRFALGAGEVDAVSGTPAEDGDAADRKAMRRLIAGDDEALRDLVD